MWRPNKIVIDQVRKIIEEGNALFEQDKELLWRLRHEIKHRFPNSLPLLLSSVKWNNKVDLSKVRLRKKRKQKSFKFSKIWEMDTTG